MQVDVAAEGLWSWNNLAKGPIESRECLGHTTRAGSLTDSAISQDELLFLSSAFPEDSATEICCLHKTTVQSCRDAVQAVAVSCRLSACDKVCRQSVCCSAELVLDCAVAQAVEHCIRIQDS